MSAEWALTVRDGLLLVRPERASSDSAIWQPEHKGDCAMGVVVQSRAPDVAPGDRVLYKSFAGLTVSLGGEQRVLLTPFDVLAKVE